MKITKSLLKKLIKEEMENVLTEDQVSDYAMRMAHPLCKLGWSIANGRLFYQANGGRNSPEDAAKMASELYNKAGKEVTVRELGMQPVGKHVDCDRDAGHGPRR